jgi:hypothetical protein
MGGDATVLLSICADAANGSSTEASNARKLTKGLDRIAGTNGNILRRGKRGKGAETANRCCPENFETFT